MTEKTKMPGKEELEKRYCEERLSSTELARIYGVCNSTIFSWMTKHKIKRRNPREAHLSEDSRMPIKEELKRVYQEENLSTAEIAKLYGVGRTTIARWVEEYGIIRRDASQAWLKPGIIKPRKEELNRLYNEEEKSAEEIAKIYRVAGRTVGIWLRKNGIKVRDKVEARWPGKKNLSEDELRRMYCEEKLSVRKISKQTCISTTTIHGLMKTCGIEQRRKTVRKGSWQNIDFALAQAKKFMDGNPRYDSLPGRDILIRNGFTGLSAAIMRYHGGYEAFRKTLNDFLGRQPVDESQNLLEVYVGGKES